MKEIYKEVVQKVGTGWLFSCTLYDGYTYQVQVDKNGNVVMVDYGSDRGGCTSRPDQDGFDNALRMAMKRILMNDQGEFVEMRNHLNSKFRDIAESVRKSQMSRFDF